MSAPPNAAIGKPDADAAVSFLSRPVTECRMCHGSNLELYLDLGLTPLADEFRASNKAASLAQVSYPLEVVVCMDCGLSQLSTVVAPEVLYQNDYPYESSTTAAGRQHFARFARDVVDDYSVRPNELAIDVGSNVGGRYSAHPRRPAHHRGATFPTAGPAARVRHHLSRASVIPRC